MLKKYPLTYKALGTQAILIEWPAKIDENIHQDILALEAAVAQQETLADRIIGYHSLTLRYPDEIDFKPTVNRLKKYYAHATAIPQSEALCWEIPVCYSTQFGLDLEELARDKKLSVAALIQQHSAPQYRVYFIGFQPGFLYLGGLPAALHTPRKANPRLRVAAGSVGIGGEQTGVYPQETSGGWNILGKSPIRFFNIHQAQPCFAKAGDRVQFVPITLQEYHEIAEAVAQGTYTLKSTTL